MIDMKCPHFQKTTAVEIVGDERFLFIIKRCNVEVERIPSSAKNIKDVLVNLDLEDIVSQIERSHGLQEKNKNDGGNKRHNSRATGDRV